MLPLYGVHEPLAWIGRPAPGSHLNTLPLTEAGSQDLRNLPVIRHYVMEPKEIRIQDSWVMRFRRPNGTEVV
jgi:hypothetical protein